jgi:hypothetical protein
MSPINLKVNAASEALLQKLEAQGLKVTRNYAYDLPELPEDITALSDASIMDLYSKLVAYHEFLSLQEWCNKTDESEQERVLKLTVANLRLSRKAKGKTPADIAAEIETDAEYGELMRAHIELQNYGSLLTLMIGGVAKNIQLVGRELSRRKDNSDFVNRSRSFTP